jgi:hypothetical protein
MPGDPGQSERPRRSGGVVLYPAARDGMILVSNAGRLVAIPSLRPLLRSSIMANEKKPLKQIKKAPQKTLKEKRAAKAAKKAAR